MLLLIFHSLQIEQILDVVLNLVISMNTTMMVVCLLRFFAFVLPTRLLFFVIPFMFCSETKRATTFDFYDRVTVIWCKHFLSSNSSTSFHCFILHYPKPLLG